MSAMQAIPSLGLAALLPLAAALPAQQDLLVQADRIFVAPDLVLAPGRLLVRDGRIAFVGDEIPAAAAAGARRLTLPGTIVPAFVSAHSQLGRAAELSESASAFTPEISAADAFDPFAPELAEAAATGLLALAFAPNGTGTFAGQAAAVRTGTTGEILQRDAYGKLAFVDSALVQERGPTSLMGAAELVRASFRRPPPGPAAATLAAMRSGGLGVLFEAERNGEIATALDLAEELQLRPILLGADKVAGHLVRLRALQGSVVLRALAPGDPLPKLTLPARLHEAGVPFSFAGESGDELRLSAALAIRHGLPRVAALAAITRVPAQQAGIADRSGTLQQGRTADFLQFDGDPLDLTARLLAVHRGGVPLAKETDR